VAALKSLGFYCDPLLIAATSGNVEVVKQLLAAGSDPNRADRKRADWNRALGSESLLFRGEAAEGRTPLHAAVFTGHVAVVELLLAAGAEPNPASHGETPTPLAIAAMENLEAVARLLLAAGAARIIKHEGRWCTVAEVAATHGHAHLCRLLADTLPTGWQLVLCPTSGEVSYARERMLVPWLVDTSSNDGPRLPAYSQSERPTAAVTGYEPHASVAAALEAARVSAKLAEVRAAMSRVNLDNFRARRPEKFQICWDCRSLCSEVCPPVQGSAPPPPPARSAEAEMRCDFLTQSSRSVGGRRKASALPPRWSAAADASCRALVAEYRATSAPFYADLIRMHGLLAKARLDAEERGALVLLRGDVAAGGGPLHAHALCDDDAPCRGTAESRRDRLQAEAADARSRRRAAVRDMLRLTAETAGLRGEVAPSAASAGLHEQVMVEDVEDHYIIKVVGLQYVVEKDSGLVFTHEHPPDYEDPEWWRRRRDVLEDSIGV